MNVILTFQYLKKVRYAPTVPRHQTAGCLSQSNIANTSRSNHDDHVEARHSQASHKRSSAARRSYHQCIRRRQQRQATREETIQRHYGDAIHAAQIFGFFDLSEEQYEIKVTKLRKDQSNEFKRN
jgi:hypothetical protein